MTPQTPLGTDDRLAIQELMARYAWSLDTGHVDAFVRCFAEGAVVIEQVFEDPDHWVGLDGIRKLAERFRNVPNFPGRQHHIGQLLLDGDAQQCKARSYAFVTECRGEPPYLLRFAGWYEDRLVKVEQRWLIAERVIRLWDGPVLERFPGHGQWVPPRRPPELVVPKE